MTRLATIILLLGALPIAAATAGSTIVINGNNDGPGSLRYALKNGASNIKFEKSVHTISITEALVYTKTKKLHIKGTGQTIDASALGSNADILVIKNGADLSISNLSFIGSNNVVNPTPLSPVEGRGIFVHVPYERKGTVKVELDTISVMRVGSHGVHVSDCTLGSNCGDGNDAKGDGSAASISVEAKNVFISNVGFGKAMPTA